MSKAIAPTMRPPPRIFTSTAAASSSARRRRPETASASAALLPDGAHEILLYEKADCGFAVAADKAGRAGQGRPRAGPGPAVDKGREGLDLRRAGRRELSATG